MTKGIFKKISPVYLLVGVLLVSFLVVGIQFLKQRRAQEAAARPKPLSAVPYYPVPKAIGSDNAPIKIVEYSDFECPSCRFAMEVVKELKTLYPEKIQLIYHHYPLAGHRWSIYAHQAAECMHIQGKFWQYHDMLYERQQEWARMTEAPVRVLMQYAEQCGANMELFGNCMVDPKVAAGIYAEKNEGTLREVNATPTFFIGDRRYIGPRELKERGQNDIRRVLGLSEIPVPPAAEVSTTQPQPAASPTPHETEVNP